MTGSRAEVAARVERFGGLLASGLTVAQAGEVMGINPHTAYNYAEAWRARLLERMAGEMPEPSPPRAVVLSWQDRSACFGHHGLFFAPDASDGSENVVERHIRETQALSLCDACPVRQDCLEDALERGERWGIRGGLTEAAREDDRKRELKRARDARWAARRAAAAAGEDGEAA